ncbi:MAG TPA: MarR family transcriptional regulator [Isosphaeraceae bacterium]|nr:MarR family transcriptional regulator [Isosphaeraceae bacterium]
MADERAIADRLHSAAIHLLRRVRRVDEATGLSGAKLSALSVVVFAGPISLRDLAAAEQVRPPSMTRTVRELELDGLITRETDDSDRRVTRIRATAKGEQLLQQGRGARIKLLADLLRALDVDDLSLLDEASKALERLFSAPMRDRKG